MSFTRSITDITYMSHMEQKKWQCAYGLLETSSLKEGATWHNACKIVCWYVMA
jgi:hypothetical protein